RLIASRGWPRRSRTAKAAHISRRAMKLCCAREWGGWGRVSVDSVVSLRMLRAACRTGQEIRAAGETASGMREGKLTQPGDSGYWRRQLKLTHSCRGAEWPPGVTFQRNLSRACRAAALSGFLRTDGRTYALKDVAGPNDTVIVVCTITSMPS